MRRGEGGQGERCGLIFPHLLQQHALIESRTRLNELPDLQVAVEREMEAKKIEQQGIEEKKEKVYMCLCLNSVLPCDTLQVSSSQPRRCRQGLRKRRRGPGQRNAQLRS